MGRAEGDMEIIVEVEMMMPLLSLNHVGDYQNLGVESVLESSRAMMPLPLPLPLPLLSLNHVSFVCKSVSESVKFYENVLGFVLIKRPSSFKFQGAWLFNYGIGIHLLESDKVPVEKREINPKENHISFQSGEMKVIMERLEEMRIEYVTAVVEEEEEEGGGGGGVKVDQLFFHDPDGYMIEICNCQNLPILPLSSSSSSCPPLKAKAPTSTNNYGKGTGMKMKNCYAEEASLMMENFVIDMMKLSI